MRTECPLSWINWCVAGLRSKPLLLSRQGAGLNGAGGVDGVGAFVDVTNNAILIDHEGDAVGKEMSESEVTVSLGYLLAGVTQQRESRAGFLGKLAIPFLAVQADPQNLRARSLELGDITLIRLDLLRSTRRGGANVEGQDDGFLAAKVGELDDLAVLVGQGEIRSAVTDLQSRRCAKQGHEKYAQQRGGSELSCCEHRGSTLVTAFLLPFAVFQEAARRVGVVGIQGLALAVDVLNHPVFVDHKRGAMRNRELIVQDPIFCRDFASEIAKQGEGHADLLGVGFVGELTVDAHSQYHGAGLLESGNISLIRLKLLRSTTGEGEHIKRQDYVLLPQKLIE